MSRAIYREQGNRFYKIRGNDMIEVDVSQLQYGVIGINYGDRTKIVLDTPNRSAAIISKAKFDKYFKMAMDKINRLK